MKKFILSFLIVTMFSMPSFASEKFWEVEFYRKQYISDGTNTSITLLIEFPKPIVLDGNTLDVLTFTINDNLSPLVKFTAAARGSIRNNPTTK